MTLIRSEKVVVHPRHNQNLFILDFIKPEKAMVVGCKKFTHIVGKNK